MFQTLTILRQDRPDRSSGYHALAPEDYVSYFTRKNVGLIVRLNKPYYSKQKFTVSLRQSGAPLSRL